MFSHVSHENKTHEVSDRTSQGKQAVIHQRAVLRQATVKNVQISISRELD